MNEQEEEQTLKFLLNQLEKHFENKMELQKADAQIKRLREALKFYECGCKEDSCTPEKPKFRSIKCGWIARAALKETGE